MSSIIDQIKKSNSIVFRRAWIKRRDQFAGTFESDWTEITNDVKKWGSVKKQIDSTRFSKFTFGNLNLVMANDEGKYNPETDEASLWYGYTTQQRTLVKIEAGFLDQQPFFLEGNPTSIPLNFAAWTTTEYPDASEGGVGCLIGLVSGDISISDSNEVSLPIKPLSQVFRDYAARNLTGFDSSMTASKFVTLLRDQTDGSGNFVFRPFFGDTTTYWDIQATTNIYSNLNTGTASMIRDMNVWDVIEKLSEAENYHPYITRDGVFKFVPRTYGTATTAFIFCGVNTFNRTYGHTIKKISHYGPKISKFYSRVALKWKEESTETSYEIRQTAMQVDGTNIAWSYGQRTLDVENTWIPTLTTAVTIADNIFSEVSSLKNEIVFTTSFIPHLELLDKVQIYYDTSNNYDTAHLWDYGYWADTSTDTSTDLIWDSQSGDAIRINGTTFKFQSIEINLDTFECKFEAREE